MVRKIIGHSYIFLILLLMYVPVLVLIAFSFTEAGNVGEWTGWSWNTNRIPNPKSLINYFHSHGLKTCFSLLFFIHDDCDQD